METAIRDVVLRFHCCLAGIHGLTAGRGTALKRPLNRKCCLIGEIRGGLRASDGVFAAQILPSLKTTEWGSCSIGLSKMQTPLHEIDMIKAQIYEDFLQSIASVRAGKNSEVAFFEHEMRVRDLRMKVAVAEARPVVRLRVVN